MKGTDNTADSAKEIRSQWKQPQPKKSEINKTW